MPVTGGGPGNPALARGPVGRRQFRATALSSLISIPSSAIEWDVFQMLPGVTAPAYLATLYEAREKTIRVELDGPGSGQFAINRASPEVSEEVLAQGNLVKVRIPEIHTDYIFGFFLETGDFTLISSEETGGEMLRFGGRGILSYTEYAKAWSTSYITGGQSPIAGVWRAYAAGTGSKPGQILRRLLEEIQDPDRPQQPLPHLTIDFDYAVDSDAVTWISTDATAEFAYQVGEDGLAIILRLIPTGVTVQMGAGFLLRAFNDYGRDLAGDAFGVGVVRFERGINIATELRRELVVDRVATHILVQGEADSYGTAVLADAADRITKEAFLAAFGTGAAALNAIGAVDLVERLDESDQIMFPIANRRTMVDLGDPITVGGTVGSVATGFYLPGPEGTNGDFWVGDTVRVHTGGGRFDYDEVDARVLAITITRDDDNHELIVIPELETLPPVPPTVASFCCLSWPDDANTGSAQPPAWTHSGDTPKAGDPVWPNREPTAGFLSKISSIPDPPAGDLSAPCFSGVLVGGTIGGDLEVTAKAGFIWTSGAATAYWRIKKNGATVAEVSAVLGPSGTVSRTVSIAGLAVVPTDVIELHVSKSSGAFKMPDGTGTSSYRMVVSGNLS